MFSHIFMVFLRTALFINLKKYLKKFFFAFFLNSVFISIYGYSQAFWLNLMTLLTFVQSNLWFSACFRFLVFIVSCKVTTTFSTFQFSFLQAKKANHCEGYVQIFKILKMNFKKILFITFFIITFYKAFIKFRNVFNTFKSFTYNFCGIAQPYKLFTSQYLRYDVFQ